VVSNYSDAQKAAVSYTPGLDEIVATPSIVKFYGKKITGFLKPVFCSYGKFTNMESLVPKGFCKALIVRWFWLKSALIFFA
jgi:hypothetical protein